MRFFATGSFQETIGESYLFGMSQGTISVVLKYILNFIENSECPKWISFRMTENEKVQAKRSFFESTGFPGVVGCVDGTHIHIVRPRRNEHLYFGKEGCHTINAMIVNNW